MAKTDEFACLHSTDRGRILYCPEFRRVVVDFKGLYLVFRVWEFERVQRHFSGMVSCPFSKARLKSGEELHVRDAAGPNSLVLDLAELEDLVELMEAASLKLAEESRTEAAGAVLG